MIFAHCLSDICVIGSILFSNSFLRLGISVGFILGYPDIVLNLITRVVWGNAFKFDH